MGIIYFCLFIRNVVARKFGSFIGLPGEPFRASDSIVVGIGYGGQYPGRHDDLRVGTFAGLALSQPAITPGTSNGTGTVAALGQFNVVAVLGSRHRRSIMCRCRILEGPSFIDAAIIGSGENGPLFVCHQSSSGNCTIVRHPKMCAVIKPAKPSNPFVPD
jgi:hypothetical protein